MISLIWLWLVFLPSAAGTQAGGVAGLQPAGIVKGRFEVPSGDALPVDLALELVPSPVSPKVASSKATVACEVRKETWKCTVPAGTLDLRLKAGGYAPLYVWGSRVKPLQTVELGTLKLRRGASVVGWVETEDGAVPPRPSKVELAPFEAGEPDVIAERRLRSTARETGVNERGFFQFDGVLPGQYSLKVTKSGFAPAQVGPVDVRADLEARMLDRIVLGRPIALDLVVEPPVDPYGQPWKIQLAAASPRTESFKGVASAEGKWRQDGLIPGPYHLKVLSDESTQWVLEEVEVDAHRDPLEIRIPLVEVQGKVTRGKDPLAATLWFGGVSAARKVRVDSNEAGRFHGFLPQEGPWPVQLAVEEGDVRVSLDPVEIRRLPGKRAAEVEIAVPDTTLVGEVVDEAGHPVSAAQIWANNIGKLRRGEDNRFQSDTEGKFRIRGLAPGQTAVRVEEGDRTSDWAQVALENGHESPWLRLVLRSNTDLHGRIVSASGAVAGVQILGIPELGEVGVSTGVSAVTDPSGEFVLSLPRDTRALNFLVFAPGFALKMAKAPLVPKTPLEISVETLGGGLVVELPAPGASSPTPLLVHGGTFFPVQLVAPWARLQGAAPGKAGRLVLPNVEVGSWALCIGGASALRQGKTPPPTQCTSGFLLPNGELALKAPGG